MATLTTPERIIYSADSNSKWIFNFSIPESWGQLPRYEMAALGQRAEGEKRFLDIALFFTDAKTATSAGKEILNRMQSYLIQTWAPNRPDMTNGAFTDRFQPGEPIVKTYQGGAVLKTSCQVVLGGVSDYIGGESAPVRDLLFLAPDPSVYVKD